MTQGLMMTHSGGEPLAAGRCSWCFLCQRKARFLPMFALLQLLHLCNGHGYMRVPPMRGTLDETPFHPSIPNLNLVDVPSSAKDWNCHFPAGDRDPNVVQPGQKSQIAAAGPDGWRPYEPTEPGFIFRSGPCGDLKTQNPQEHLRGGRYYYPADSAFISTEYEQGGILSATVAIVGHHNGYFEFTLCDIDNCPGGEISESCLRDGNICRKLHREPQEECQVGNNPNCGPIDSHNPTRWYLPCNQSRHNLYGDGYMKYRLPQDVHCEHCVLQMYWVAANYCNPPGLLQYFRGPDGPNWGDCPGEGQAVGGYRPWGKCGEKHPTKDEQMFPEEYYQCADIRINPMQHELTASPSPLPQAANPIDSLDVFVDGIKEAEVKNGEQKWLQIGSKPVTFRAYTTSENLRKVWFHVQGEPLWEEANAPYVFKGNSGSDYSSWNNPIYNTWFWVSVTAEDEYGRRFFTSYKIYLGSS